MTRSELNILCNTIRVIKYRSDKLERIRQQIEALRDAAVLPTTKAIYQAILDLFDEE